MNKEILFIYPFAGLCSTWSCVLFTGYYSWWFCHEKKSDDYVALVLIGGFGWNTPVAEKVMPIIKSAIEQEKVIGAICNAASFMAKCGIDRETTSKTLQKSSVIQKISVTLSSVIIAIIVCKLLIFNTLRLQQFFANHHFSGTYISSNSR